MHVLVAVTGSALNTKDIAHLLNIALKHDSRLHTQPASLTTSQQGALAGAKLAFKLDEKMTPAAVERKVKEVLASRGRKGTDPRDVLRQLSALAYVSRRFGPARELPVMMHAVARMFDTLRNIDDYMETVMWKSCHSYLSRVRCSSYYSAHMLFLYAMYSHECVCCTVLFLAC